MRTTARMAAFMPGASPPLVRTAMRLMSGASYTGVRGRASKNALSGRDLCLDLCDSEITDMARPKQESAPAKAPEKNYITPAGHRKLSTEFDFLRSKKRPGGGGGGPPHAPAAGRGGGGGVAELC